MRNSKENWLVKGLDVLVKSGASGLTIERLCKKAGKTKGSFYHHFQNRGDFCQQLLEYWEEKHTEELIQATIDDSPDAALRELHELAQALPPERETAFRSWSTHSEQAADVVRRVDNSRVEHLQKLYKKAGNSPELARTLAWMEYCLFLGAAQLQDTFPLEERKNVRIMIERLENRK